MYSNLRDFMVNINKASCRDINKIGECMKRNKFPEYKFTGDEILSTIESNNVILTYTENLLDCDKLLKLFMEIKFFLRDDKKTDIEVNLLLCEVGDLTKTSLGNIEVVISVVERFLETVLQRLEDHFGKIVSKTIRDVKISSSCVSTSQGITVTDSYGHAFYRFQEDILKSLQEGNELDANSTILHLKKMIYDRLRRDRDISDGIKYLLSKVSNIKGGNL